MRIVSVAAAGPHRSTRIAQDEPVDDQQEAARNKPAESTVARMIRPVLVVFVHIPRTGRTFVRRVVDGHVAVTHSFDAHASYEDLPTSLADLPAFCVVRNPWDW